MFNRALLLTDIFIMIPIILKFMRPERVHSPELNRYFGVADNQTLTDARCPIDGTNLLTVSEYDFSHYSCPACSTHYSWGVTDPALLQEEARGCVQDRVHDAERLEEQRQQLGGSIGLDKFLELARQKGLTPV